jgi:nucleotide-binding universal stress UspA family protein
VTLLYITKNSVEPGSLARTHLDRAVATLRASDINGEVRVREAAAPAEGILAEASEGDYDLIVVGGHVPKSRSVFRIDNVTMQVMTGADRPVLVVPTGDIS